MNFSIICNNYDCAIKKKLTSNFRYLVVYVFYFLFDNYNSYLNEANISLKIPLTTVHFV